MTVRFSTGLRNAVASTYGLGQMMNGGVIYVYGGTIPASPDNAPGSAPLGIITTDGLMFTPGDNSNGAGLSLQTVSPGGLLNYGTWVLKGMNTGTATWFRWCWLDPDSFQESTYYPRVDGDIGSAFILPVTNINPSTSLVIDSFLIVLPMGG